MHKIIFGHLFAAAILLGIWQYQPSVTGLMASALLALMTMEMGFLAYHAKNILFRVLAIVIWCFFYPQTLSILMGVADLTWDSSSLWSTEGMKPFMVYLAVLVFAVVAATLSTQLILKSFKLNLYVQLVLIPIIALLATATLLLGQTTALGWGDFLSSPLNFAGQVVSALSTANVPFVVGFAGIQTMLLILLGDD